MFRHRWKILIGIALAFVLLTGIELATIGNDPKKEVEAYKKSLIAKGERLDISELLPPPVPPEQNGADTVNEALNLLPPEDYKDSSSIPAMQLIAPGKAIVCFEQPDVRGLYFTNSWANELDVVADERPITELLRQAAAYPAIDFHLDYGNGPFADTPYIRPLVYSGHMLATEAVYDLHQGDVASAVTNISAMLALVNGLQDERLLIFQEVRIYMTWITANANWELLQSTNLNDSQLALLQSCWERLEFIRATENAFLMERARSESEFMKMQTSDEYFNKEANSAQPSYVDWSDGLHDGLDGLMEQAKFACAKSMFHASWIYSDELRMLEDDQNILETIRTAETNRFFNPAYRDMLKQLGARAMHKPNDWFARSDDFGFHDTFADAFHAMFELNGGERNPVSLTMGSEATRRMVITAIALKRYQLKHGNYPKSLSDLTPEFISNIPQDPVDGKPLRYRFKADGNFLLYSIGENGKDDGGDGSSKRNRKYYTYHFAEPELLDWVWPQPATATEIQYFYDHAASP